MKVLNLQCSNAHAFEGWFSSEEDFQGQLARGIVACPMCEDCSIRKLPSAPRLNFGAAEPAKPAANAQVPVPQQHDVALAPDAALQAAWLQVVRRVMNETVDVGRRFAEEARRMHYGETEERGIRGEATREETEALLEEGIPVLPLPIPKALKEPLQ